MSSLEPATETKKRARSANSSTSQSAQSMQSTQPAKPTRTYKKRKAEDAGASAPPAPMAVTTELWAHQKDCIRKMRQKEMAMFDVGQNLGVLCEDMGGGKTLIVLAALVGAPRVQANYEAYVTRHSSLLGVLARIVQQYLEWKPSQVHSVWAAAEKRLQRRIQAGHDERRLFCNPFALTPTTVPGTLPAVADADAPGVSSANNHLVDSYTIIDSNLVVVPFHLFRQWKDELTKHTQNVKCHFLHSTRDAMDAGVFAKNDLVICNSNKYNRLARYCHERRLCWQRAVFDETHAVRIPHCEPIASLFYWAVTTTYTSLHAINRNGFLRDLFARLSLEQLQRICVQADGPLIHRKCFESFPPYIKYTIKCTTPAHVLILNALYPQTALSSLINEQQDDDAHTYLTRCIRADLDDASSPFAAVATLKQMNVLELKFVHLAVSRSRYHSHFVETQRVTLRKATRLHQICLHCLGRLSADSAYVSTCCGLPYCGKCCQVPEAFCSGSCAAGSSGSSSTSGPCGASSASSSASSSSASRESKATASASAQGHAAFSGSRTLNTALVCPCCGSLARVQRDLNRSADDNEAVRAQHEQLYDQYRRSMMHRQTKNAQRRAELNQAQLQTHIGNFVAAKCPFVRDHVCDKFEACERILEQVKSERTLIFVSNTRTNRRLLNIFAKLGIKSSEVKYQAAVIAKRLKQLESGELQVLVLNQRHVGSGLSIQAAQNIIIISISSKQLLMQDIARAQRPGRVGTLRVFELE